MNKNLAFAFASLFVPSLALSATVLKVDENIATVKLSPKESRLFSAYDEVAVVFEDGDSVDGKIIRKMKGRKAKILLSEDDVLDEGDDISIKEPYDNHDVYDDEDAIANSYRSRLSFTTGRSWYEAKTGDNFSADLYNVSLLLKVDESPLVFGADLGYMKYKLEEDMSGSSTRIDMSVMGGFSKDYGEIEPYVLGLYSLYSRSVLDTSYSNYEDGYSIRASLSGKQEHEGFLALKFGTIIHMSDKIGLVIEGVMSSEYKQKSDYNVNLTLSGNGSYENSYEEVKFTQKISHTSLALGIAMSL